MTERQTIRFVVHRRNDGNNNINANINPWSDTTTSMIISNNLINNEPITNVWTNENYRNNISVDRDIHGIFMLLNHMNNHINDPSIYTRTLMTEEIDLDSIFGNMVRSEIMEDTNNSEPRAHERQEQINVELNCYSYSEIPEAEDIKECSICLNKFEPNSKISILKCDHVYCHSCLEEWCHYNNSCPVCRKIID